jgi:hypothetical protein
VTELDLASDLGPYDNHLHSRCCRWREKPKANQQKVTAHSEMTHFDPTDPKTTRSIGLILIGITVLGRLKLRVPRPIHFRCKMAK